MGAFFFPGLERFDRIDISLFGLFRQLCVDIILSYRIPIQISRIIGISGGTYPGDDLFPLRPFQAQYIGNAFG